jgi:hypothetical protein
MLQNREHYLSAQKLIFYNKEVNGTPIIRYYVIRLLLNFASPFLLLYVPHMFHFFFCCFAFLSPYFLFLFHFLSVLSRSLPPPRCFFPPFYVRSLSLPLHSYSLISTYVTLSFSAAFSLHFLNLVHVCPFIPSYQHIVSLRFLFFSLFPPLHCYLSFSSSPPTLPF